MNSDDRQEALMGFAQEATEVILRYFGALNASEIVGALEIIKIMTVEKIGTSISIHKSDDDE
ncbi:MAG: hypothetical protein LLG15_02100 [Betaproteobacteria bacterium]|nr:hypothetical protein [Betaproteobacteria bacterium]